MAHTVRRRYEWVQHEAIAVGSGVTTDEIAAIADGTADVVFGRADAAVVRLCAEAPLCQDQVRHQGQQLLVELEG